MASFRVLLQLSILAAAYAKRCAGSKIHWGSCDQAELNATGKIDCGNVRVPLDYTDKVSNKTLEIELVRWRAAVQPSKGSILLNFGGPGLTGRSSLVATGPLLQALSGGVYDLVVFDTRGTGKTLPFTCTDKPQEIDAIMGSMSDSAANSSDTAIGRIWATSTVVTNKCRNYHNETGRLLSTAFGARDLISIVDALEEDGMLRYWGKSGGAGGRP
jgi:pimeloyl-ACP methyl ester carboxylesterase